ncbi:hypothetical protein [Sulfurimonas sp.]|uniref:hypothetical protein n=1 Tax=Sulfurimonas sp. TaxID=2022749 RepID=UPI002AB0AD3A|nr:hypothetical protein [Sulfurimonas sp.]
MEFDREEHNMVYYNQILRSDKKKKIKKKKKAQSFAKQEVNFKDYLYIPNGWEPILYTVYFVLIPYVTGAVFLFLTIAGADFANFKLLNMAAFFIVWIIGYEIVATIMLIGILIMFLKYDDEDD